MPLTRQNKHSSDLGLCGSMQLDAAPSGSPFRMRSQAVDNPAPTRPSQLAA
jgi:hypothetical protein